MTTKRNHVASSETDDLLPTRRTLLARLKNWGDDSSWQEFFELYWRLIYNVGLKAGLNETEAQEVVQETVISVAKAMKGFSYDPDRGSFKGWLLQLAGWRITNQFNKRRHGGAVPSLSFSKEEVPPIEQSLPPELERLWDAEWEENLYRTALELVQRRVNPKHFQIFDLCVTQQKPVDAVRQFLGISAMQVYLSRHRIARLIQEEIKRLRQKRI